MLGVLHNQHGELVNHNGMISYGYVLKLNVIHYQYLQSFYVVT